MDFFISIVFFLSIVAFFVFLVWLVIALIARKRKKTSVVGLIISFVLVIISFLIIPASESDDDQPEIQEKGTISETYHVSSESDKDNDTFVYSDYDNEVEYKQLERNPDQYEGQKTKFSGFVIQVIESEDENQGILWLDDFGDDYIYFGYDPDLLDFRLLEDDYITIYGVLAGLYSYESTAGNLVTLPCMWVEKIDFEELSTNGSSIQTPLQNEIAETNDSKDESSPNNSQEKMLADEDVNTANIRLSDDPLNMKLGEIAEYHGLYVSLMYVKSQTYLQTVLDYMTEDVAEGHQVVYAIFEIYNPGNEAVTFSRSSVEGYCDGTKADAVDSNMKIACDGVYQLDDYELYPNTRTLAVFDFEVPAEISEIKFYCGNNDIWSVNASEITTEKFNMETTVFPDASAPKAQNFSVGDIVYSDDYELVYQGVQIYTYSNSITDPTDYVIFKFQLNNTGSEELDYDFVGYSMRCYGDGLLLDECDYIMDDKIDGYINLFDVGSVKPGMSASFYLPFELTKSATDFYLIYNQGYIVDDVLFEMTASIGSTS